MSEEDKKAQEIVVSTAGGGSSVAEAGDVYEGGGLMRLTVDDLVGNKIAVTQLINQHNVECRRRVDAETRLAKREGEIEYLKTSPFVAISGAVSSVTGSIVIGVGLKQLAASMPFGYTLLTVGGLLIVSGSLASILYPFARGWFNRHRATTSPT